MTVVSLRKPPSRRPLLFDLFCGAGGAARGYEEAGFDVIGVDINPQPHYPYKFIQANALTFMGRLVAGYMWERLTLGDFAAVHASPPCQGYSAMKVVWNGRKGHPMLVEPVRELLQASGKPWVMENVPGAPLANPVMLCGSMFGLGYNEYQLRRHRLFEISGFTVAPLECQHDTPVIGVYGGHGRDRRRGGGDLPIGAGYAAMGIDWMNGKEVSESIPPAYTEYIGGHLLEAITQKVAA